MTESESERPRASSPIRVNGAKRQFEPPSPSERGTTLKTGAVPLGDSGDILSHYGNIDWRLNLENASGSIVELVTRNTPLCSDRPGGNTSRTRYVPQTGRIYSLCLRDGAVYYTHNRVVVNGRESVSPSRYTQSMYPSTTRLPECRVPTHRRLTPRGTRVPRQPWMVCR
jgi:hypothetical protein